YTMTVTARAQAVKQVCPSAALLTYLAFTPPKRPLTRVFTTYFVPTQDEWASGIRTVRCDASMANGTNTLQAFSGTLASKITKDGTLGWAWCTSANKKLQSTFAPGECGTGANTWIVVDQLTMNGTKYPGIKTGKRTASSMCLALVRKHTNAKVGRNSMLLAIYAFPNAISWTQGNRTVTCGMKLSQSQWV
ncbi:MAG: septum formation family protein, partial [Candidatus Nanopelagicales bacterium]